MISKAIVRYHTDPSFRAGMLRYGRAYERLHRTERNAWKRRYRRTLTARQKRLARASHRRWYIHNRAKILSNARAAYVARIQAINRKPV